MLPSFFESRYADFNIFSSVGIYHDQCLLEWCGEKGASKETCPYCRRQLFRCLHLRFVPCYRFDPHDGLWRNGNGLTVSDQHVSDYIVDLWELETEESQDEETGQIYEVHPIEYDRAQFVYNEGRWWDFDGCEVFPHKVHDFLTGGSDDLEGQRVAAVWDRTHNNLETPDYTRPYNLETPN